MSNFPFFVFRSLFVAVRSGNCREHKNQRSNWFCSLYEFREDLNLLYRLGNLTLGLLAFLPCGATTSRYLSCDHQQILSQRHLNIFPVFLEVLAVPLRSVQAEDWVTFSGSGQSWANSPCSTLHLAGVHSLGRSALLSVHRSAIQHSSGRAGLLFAHFPPSSFPVGPSVRPYLASLKSNFSVWATT